MSSIEERFKVALLLSKDMAHRVLHPDDVKFLQSFADIQDIEQLPEKADEPFMKRAIKDADACITCWGTPKLTDDILKEAPSLKVLAHGAGTPRAVVTDAVWERNIRVFTAAPIIAIDVAETVLGIMIVSLKRIWQFNSQTHKGLWTHFPEVDREVDGMKRLWSYLTVGIIGASHVGRNLIKMLKSFEGVQIMLYDPYVTEQQAKDLGVVKVSLDELMSISDVVTCHAPNIPETYHIVNKENLALMKKGTLFINTSRGALVDEDALIAELKTGRIFACLDVTDPEPPTQDNVLRILENVILTPHISGGHTINGRYQQGRYIIQELYNCLMKGHLQNEVTKDMMTIIA